jgi:hypothetical protein
VSRREQVRGAMAVLPAPSGLRAALTVLNERQLRKLRQGGYPQGETRGDRDETPATFPWARWRPSFGKRLQTTIDYNFGPQAVTIRREQVREAIDRRRRKHGLLWRPILVTKSQLDQLEERGYLDPGRRGEPLDECDAIAMFLTDAVPKAT